MCSRAPRTLAYAIRRPTTTLGAAVVMMAAIPARLAAQGVGLTLQGHTFVVERVDPNGLAARAGLRAGDRLVRVGGRTLGDASVDAAARQRLTTTTEPMTVDFVRDDRMHFRLLGDRADIPGRNAAYAAREDELAAARRQAQVADTRTTAGSNAMPVAAAAAQPPAAGDGLCRLGQRVEAAEDGRWLQAVVIGVRPATEPFNGTMIEQRYRCRTHPIGYENTMDSWKPVSFLRPVGAGRSEPIPGGPNAYDATLDSIRRGGATAPAAAAVATGHYTCATFQNGMLVTTGDFTITGASTYSAAGGAGTYAYNPQTGLLQFRGSAFGGHTADYVNRVRPMIYIHGTRGNRIMDCERGS